MSRMNFMLDPGSEGPEPAQLAPRHSELVTRDHGLPEGVRASLDARPEVGGVVAVGRGQDPGLDGRVEPLHLQLQSLLEAGDEGEAAGQADVLDQMQVWSPSGFKVSGQLLINDKTASVNKGR